jgi:UPF0716 protein FxsA
MGMLLPLLLWPLAEIATFVAVGQVIGVGGVVLGLILGAMAGFAVLRRSGLRAADAIRRGSEIGDAQALGGAIDSAWMALAGALLIIPGFLSDIAALALLSAPIRRWLVRQGRRPIAMSRFNVQFSSTAYNFTQAGTEPAAPVIDGEFHEVGTKEIGKEPNRQA